MAEKDKQLTTPIAPSEPGFREKITPKKPDLDKVFFFRCSCGHAHMRHAGYMEVLTPCIIPGEKYVGKTSENVHICVKCKKSYVWLNGQMYDVTDEIDLEAWEKTEEEAHKATGPGGQC